MIILPIFLVKKIVIRGNHDYWWKSISAVRDFLPSGCYALQNDAVKIGDYIFAVVAVGAQGIKTPLKMTDCLLAKFCEWVLPLTMQKIRKENEKIIVLTHFPPFDSKRSSNEMTALFEQNGVTAVVYGHLHGKISEQMHWSKKWREILFDIVRPS